MNLAVGVDPGDTSGVAIVDADSGSMLGLHQFTIEEFESWLADYLKTNQPVAVVIEDFRLFRGRAGSQAGSRFKASQVIAITRMACRLANVPFVLQEISKKVTGAKFSQVPVPRNHAHSHMIDAYNHVFYWLVTHRGVKTYAQRQAERASEIDRATEEGISRAGGNRD